MLHKKVGLKKKHVTQKQRRSICVQYLKPSAFQISIPKWIEQFPSLIFHSYQRVNLQFASLHCSSSSIKSYNWCEGMYVVSILCTPNLKSIVHIKSLCVKTPRLRCCIMRWITCKDCVFNSKYILDDKSHVSPVGCWSNSIEITTQNKK